MAELKFEWDTTFRDEKSAPGAIGLDIELVREGTDVVGLTAYVDTGAAYCVFRPGYAELLDIPVREGKPTDLYTASGGLVKVYLHYLRMRIHTFHFDVEVGFYENEGPRNPNLLGRLGFLDQVRLGLVYADSRLFMSPYNGKYIV